MLLIVIRILSRRPSGNIRSRYCVSGIRNIGGGPSAYTYLIPVPYCDGAEWHGGSLMRISQFMGRLAEVNRTDITHHRQTRQTDTHTQASFSVQFSSIQSVSDVHFRRCLMSAHSGPVCSPPPPSPCRILYGQQ